MTAANAIELVDAFLESRLILAISRLAAHSGGPKAFVEAAANLILDSGEFDEVTIAFCINSGDALSATTRQANATAVVSCFLSRDLVVRGKRFGHIELRSGRQPRNPSQLLQAVDCAAQQLALFAELESARALQRALSQEIDDTVRHLKTMKLVAHASAIIAANRGIPQPVAMDWLQAESQRAKKSIWHFAEQLIVHYKSQRRPRQVLEKIA